MVRVLSAQLLAFCSMLLAQAPKLPDISYDPQAPLDLQQSPVKDLGHARLLDISYYSAMDAERFIGQAAPAALFLQFARYDRFITEEQANRYAKAASTPKLVRWYECGHEFNDAQSTADRENWLARQLSLSEK
jgi:hypothetical protein